MLRSSSVGLTDTPVVLRTRVAAPSIRGASLASCWPLPQQLLPVSATGGGRRRCWAYSAEELFLISRLSRSAERSKRIFTKGAVAGNAVCRCNPSREKAILENPQIFQNCKYKNIFSAEDG